MQYYNIFEKHILSSSISTFTQFHLYEILCVLLAER